MSFNHKDIVIFFSKMVATVINYVLVIGFIIIVVVVVYQMVTFVVNPYKGKKEPGKVFSTTNISAPMTIPPKTI